MEKGEFQKLVNQIEGLTYEEDCFTVYSLAKDLNVPGAVLEIGNYKGRVTVSLAKAQEEIKGAKVYSIDVNLFSVKNDFLNNIAKFNVKDWVVPLFAHSAQANKGWQEQIKLIWIDADGNHCTLKSDFMLWERYLATGGVIACGGFNCSGVKKFFDETIACSQRFGPISRTGNMAYAYKLKETPAHSRWKIEYTRLVYFTHFTIKIMLHNFLRFFMPGLKGKDFFLKKIINRLFERLFRV